jgi:YjbE family integral membrane protein
MEAFLTPAFWVAVGQIILIDILLGGDNAVVIALACRKLPGNLRTKGILWGTAGAIVLRVILIFFALTLLAIPFLKIVGAVLLVWIGVKLLLPEEEEGHGTIEASDKLWGAVKTVIVADLVMSVDNVIAIAGAAQGAGQQHQMPLVVFGLLVSIPIIVWGSQLVIKLMDRYPIIITAGGMLLGWIAGTMAVTDPALIDPATLPQMPKLANSDLIRYGAGVAGALLVLLLGKWLASRRAKRPHAPAAQAAATAAAPGGLSSVLLAVDGSENSARAVRQWIGMQTSLRDPTAVRLHLINVQRPVSGDVSSFIASKSLEEYHRERSDVELVPAQTLLDAAGVPYETHRIVGPAGQSIANLASSLGCDLIMMGTRGQGGAAAALLGSVAQSTVEHAGVPVLLVK